MNEPCPCGSGRTYSQCCRPYHQGRAVPATAEALMRSRYTAFVLRLGDYLLATWQAGARPAGLELDNDPTAWEGLEILDTRGGGEEDERGEVEFVARYQGGQMHECSRFVKAQGRWYYVDGDMLAAVEPARVGRNAPCPCGSGKKFKRCCGQ